MTIRFYLYFAAIIAALALGSAACGNDAGSDGTTGGNAAVDSGGTTDGSLDSDAKVTDGAAAGKDTTTAATDAGAADAGTKTTCGSPTGERPARRSEQSGGWDPAGKRLVMFGGSFAVPQNCSFVAASSETETWIYDSACNSWVQSKSTGPVGRARAASVWKADTGLIVFGGRSRVGKSGPYTLYKDMWAFDPDTDKWTQLSTGGSIPKRFNASMVLRDDSGALLVFGGNTSGSAVNYTPNNDVWSYNFQSGSWSKVSTAGTPPSKRFFTGGLWDSKRKRLIVYGGADASLFSPTAKFKDDLWALDFAQKPAKWIKIDSGSNDKPAGRYWGSIVYDKTADRYILFGGHNDLSLGNTNDLWGFAAESGQWANMIEGDTFNKPAISFCNFPPDFTNVKENLPERRNGGLVVGSVDGVWIAGGKTDCGVIDDLQFYAYKTGKWSKLTTSTVGEACLRKGGVNCNDYCQ